VRTLALSARSRPMHQPARAPRARRYVRREIRPGMQPTPRCDTVVSERSRFWSTRTVADSSASLLSFGARWAGYRWSPAVATTTPAHGGASAPLEWRPTLTP
jgi:hypothetical protein